MKEGHEFSSDGGAFPTCRMFRGQRVIALMRLRSRLPLSVSAIEQGLAWLETHSDRIPLHRHVGPPPAVVAALAQPDSLGSALEDHHGKRKGPTFSNSSASARLQTSLGCPVTWFLSRLARSPGDSHPSEKRDNRRKSCCIERVQSLAVRLFPH